MTFEWRHWTDAVSEWTSWTPEWALEMRVHNREFKTIFKRTQAHLGNAEKNWNIGPIRVEGNSYPETICNELTKDVIVRVTQSTIQYPLQRTYQLIHESVHCLSPRNKRDTLFFEEGLANWYALTHQSLPESYRNESEKILDPLLAKPYKVFCKLKPSYTKIAALRNDCPGLDDVTSSLIMKHFGVPQQIADQLMERMSGARPSVMM
jgi:hypothetical protein